MGKEIIGAYFKVIPGPHVVLPYCAYFTRSLVESSCTRASSPPAKFGSTDGFS
jgi:hypothetical protein